MMRPSTAHDRRAVPALEAQGVQVMRGDRPVVRGIDLVVPYRGVIGIVGRNGAGKTTLLEGLAGLLPRSGRVLVAGEDRSRADALAMSRAGVVLSPQSGGTFPGLRVNEHLRIAEEGRDPATRTSLTPAVSQLCEGRAEQSADTLSGGERRLLALAMVARRAPHVALLDEPSEGVAPIILPELVDAIRVLASRCAVVLVEQRPALLRALAEHIVVLDRGEVVATGGMEELERIGVLEGVLGP
jgi:branched-chain amino acid transport system ATP-binding protein